MGKHPKNSQVENSCAAKISDTGATGGITRVGAQQVAGTVGWSNNKPRQRVVTGMRHGVRKVGAQKGGSRCGSGLRRFDGSKHSVTQFGVRGGEMRGGSFPSELGNLFRWFSMVYVRSITLAPEGNILRYSLSEIVGFCQPHGQKNPYGMAILAGPKIQFRTIRNQNPKC